MPVRRSVRPLSPKLSMVLPVLASMRRQEAGVDEQQAAVGPVLAFPVAHAARSHGAHVGMSPQFLAGGCVQRDETNCSGVGRVLRVGVVRRLAG